MAKGTKPKTYPENSSKINIWKAVRDIGIASINKGQFFGVLITIGVIVVVIKMPPSDVSKLAFEVLNHLVLYHILGWVLSLLLIIMWFIIFRQLRKRQIEELNRLAKEKDELQRVLLDKIK